MIKLKPTSRFVVNESCLLAMFEYPIFEILRLAKCRRMPSSIKTLKTYAIFSFDESRNILNVFDIGEDVFKLINKILEKHSFNNILSEFHTKSRIFLIIENLVKNSILSIE